MTPATPEQPPRCSFGVPYCKDDHPGHEAQARPAVASEGLRAALLGLLAIVHQTDQGPHSMWVFLSDPTAAVRQARAALAAPAPPAGLDVEWLADHQPEARCHDGDADVGCSCGEWVSFRVGRVGYPTWPEHIAAAYRAAGEGAVE